MRDTLQLEECIVCFHTFDIDLIPTVLRILQIEIVSSFKIENLGRIPTSIIHRMRYVDSLLFCQLEVDLTELWSLVSDTSTIGVGDEVCMVYLMILVSVFLIIILWKWWHISESDEVRSLEFSDHCELSLPLEYCFEPVFGYDILLSTILYENIVDIVPHSKCHIGRDRPRSSRPCEDRYSMYIWSICD